MRQLRRPLRDIARDGIVAVTRLEPLITVEAARVVEQIAHRDLGRYFLIQLREVRQVVPHWGIERQHAVVDEMPNGGAGESLAQRANLE